MLECVLYGYITGTPVRMPGLLDHLHAFAQTEELSRVGVTKAGYEEWGGERLDRCWGGNWNASVGVIRQRGM